MDSSFWLSRWSSGQIGFHRSDLHPDLRAHHERWLGDSPGAVLVPLCGKTVDLSFVAQRTPTVGVELAEQAVIEFHQEQKLDPILSERDGFTAYDTANLTVLQGDIFGLTADHVRGVDRVWDRAAMVALQPEQRQRYVALLRSLLPPESRVLLNVLTYDQTVMPGPPHSVTDDEVRGAYAGCHIELLDVDERLDERWKARGHSWWQRRLYLITT